MASDKELQYHDDGEPVFKPYSEQSHAHHLRQGAVIMSGAATKADLEAAARAHAQPYKDHWAHGDEIARISSSAYEAGALFGAEQAAPLIKELLDEIDRFKSELENPVPDAIYRNVLRQAIFKKAAAIRQLFKD